MLNVRIPRDRWDRGHVGHLLNPETGRLCVLGHCLRACGVPEDVLRGRSTVLGLAPFAGIIPTSLVQLKVDLLYETPHAEDLIDINDSGWLDDDEREQRLAEAALPLGFLLEFV